MAVLIQQQVTLAGPQVTPGPAGVSGDKVQPGPTSWIEVTNASGASVNVTVDSKVPSNYGSDDNVVRAVAPGETRRIGPLVASRFAGSDGLVDVSYSATASVSVASVRV